LKSGILSPHIVRALLSAGFTEFGFVSRASLSCLSETLDPRLSDRYGLKESAGAIVVAFPYDPRPVHEPAAPADGALGPPPYASIGAFASQNRYATMVRLLGAVGHDLAVDSGLSAKAFRIAVNSRLSEKRLAVIAGLGFVGRSSLVVTNAYGPACLLGILLLPDDFNVAHCNDGAGASGKEGETVSGCGSCRACADASPTGAIGIRDGAAPALDTARCIQYWASAPGTVPEGVRMAWRNTLYGCDLCTAACPRSSAVWTSTDDSPSPAELADLLVSPQERKPGRFISAALVSGADDAALRTLFRKTALGMSWITPDCLRRNARLASGLD